jgi:SRSO17 transposase
VLRHDRVTVWWDRRWLGVDVQGLLRLDADLKNFVDDVFVSLRRKGWQERCHCYLTGLMVDGRRKSVQPMAVRLDEPNDQSLQHFLANTPWDPVPVRRRLAVRMHNVIGPWAWVVDDTGFVKDGRMSPCVARQYTGTAGKVTNCQVATTLHLATDRESCPVNWRLFMPESWDPSSERASVDVHQRRAAAGIPDGEHHRPKWQLALECVDEALSWGLPAPGVLAADAGYGDSAALRHGLSERGICYAVQISHTLSVLPATATRSSGPYSGRGRRPVPRYQQPACSVKEHIMALGPGRAARVTWRSGSRKRQGQPQPMTSRFVFCRVRQADHSTRSLHQGHNLPECWLIAEWPARTKEPTRYWLCTLPSNTSRARLIRAAKQRWRIEHDYRELKTGLGLDHYEGRKWAGWHHHVTLVSAAHGFLTWLRHRPKAPVPE